MIGYKIIEKNTLKSDYEEMTFEIGKVYKSSDIPQYPDIYEFSFYKTLEDAYAHNELTGDVIFKVEIYGDISDSKYVENCAYCKKIRIINEIPDKFIKEYIKNRSDKLADTGTKDVKFILIRDGYCIDKLTKDPDPEVRGKVAWNGYNLDILEKDESPIVKEKIKKAKQLNRY